MVVPPFSFRYCNVFERCIYSIAIFAVRLHTGCHMLIMIHVTIWLTIIIVKRPHSLCIV